MATQNIKLITVAKTISGNSPYTLALPIAATQTFKRGAAVTTDGNGKIIECGTDPGRILGFAAEDANNIAVPVASDVVHVFIADDDTVFRGSVDITHVTSLADVGFGYGVTKDALGSGIWTIDKAKIGSSRRVIIHEICKDPPNVVGDTAGQVLFQVYENATAFYTTS